MTSILQPLAEKGDYPVLITAQVYEKDGEIGPYFGKSLMHLCKTIIHLEKTKTPGLFDYLSLGASGYTGGQ